MGGRNKYTVYDTEENEILVENVTKAQIENILDTKVPNLFAYMEMGTRIKGRYLVVVYGEDIIIPDGGFVKHQDSLKMRWNNECKKFRKLPIEQLINLPITVEKAVSL